MSATVTNPFFLSCVLPSSPNPLSSTTVKRSLSSGRGHVRPFVRPSRRPSVRWLAATVSNLDDSKGQPLLAGY
jgi:hypothetical protein